MEQEKLAREKAEKEEAEKAKKMKESFGDATSQWEKDKTEMQNIALQEKKKEAIEAAKEKLKDEGPGRVIPKAENQDSKTEERR